jgi:large subunit ribosomal protein L35
MSGKAKTHKGLKKRLKRSGTGKVLHRSPGKRHLMSGKPSRRVQRLSTWKQLTKGERKSLERQYGPLAN